MATDAVGVDDMVFLPTLSEQDILENTKKRFLKGFIYTNVSSAILVAV